MSEFKNIPKVPEGGWPTLELVRPEGADLAQPWVPQPGENDMTGFEVEDYIPISALLSDEVKHAVGRVVAQALRNRSAQIERCEAGNAEMETPGQVAEAALQAAIEQVGGSK